MKPKFTVGSGVVLRDGRKGVIKKIGRPGGDAYNPKKRHPLGRWTYLINVGRLVVWQPERLLRLWTSKDFRVKRNRRRVWVVSRGFMMGGKHGSEFRVRNVLGVYKRWNRAERYCAKWRDRESRAHFDAALRRGERGEIKGPVWVVEMEHYTGKKRKTIDYIRWGNGLVSIDIKQFTVIE